MTAQQHHQFSSGPIIAVAAASPAMTRPLIALSWPTFGRLLGLHHHLAQAAEGSVIFLTGLEDFAAEVFDLEPLTDRVRRFRKGRWPIDEGRLRRDIERTIRDRKLTLYGSQRSVTVTEGVRDPAPCQPMVIRGGAKWRARRGPTVSPAVRRT